jgi:magnesium-transporting ATPase (P-type)
MWIIPRIARNFRMPAAWPAGTGRKPRRRAGTAVALHSRLMSIASASPPDARVGRAAPPGSGAADAWHAKAIEDVRAALDSPEAGLGEEEARRRLARHGPNRLSPPAPASVLRIFLDQLKGIVVVLLVTDTFPALALALEPGDADVMRRPPRDPEEAVLSRRFLARVGGYGLLITLATLAAYALALRAEPARAGSVAFMTLALAQIFHLGNARSDEDVVRPHRALANPYALAAVALALQAAAMYAAPLAGVLRVAPLTPGEWALAAGLGAVPAVAGQALKLVHGRR